MTVETRESAAAYIRRLKKDGWRQLGSGHFSTVLSKPGESYVMRVNNGDDYDAGWEEFTQRLISSDKIKSNPHFARYGEVKRFKYTNRKGLEYFYLVGQVERLYRLPTVDYDSASCTIDKLLDSRSGKKKNPIIPKTLYEATDFLIDIRKKTKHVNLRFAIHENNLMSRKNGELVITDPFSYDYPSDEDNLDSNFLNMESHGVNWTIESY